VANKSENIIALLLQKSWTECEDVDCHTKHFLENTKITPDFSPKKEDREVR